MNDAKSVKGRLLQQLQQQRWGDMSEAPPRSAPVNEVAEVLAADDAGRVDPGRVREVGSELWRLNKNGLFDFIDTGATRTSPSALLIAVIPAKDSGRPVRSAGTPSVTLPDFHISSAELAKRRTMLEATSLWSSSWPAQWCGVKELPQTEAPHAALTSARSTSVDESSDSAVVAVKVNPNVLKRAQALTVLQKKLNKLGYSDSHIATCVDRDKRDEMQKARPGRGLVDVHLAYREILRSPPTNPTDASEALRRAALAAEGLSAGGLGVWAAEGKSLMAREAPER